MTIREYFDNMMKGLTDEEMDEVFDLENTIYQCYEDDYDDFCIWAIENGIDINATETVGRDVIPVLTLWAWDMCGD
jgi:hypothetical protein